MHVISIVHIVTYLLKARTVEPGKQPLLTNGSETTFISRLQLDKHVSTATDTHATIEVLLEMVFSTRSVQRGCKDNWSKNSSVGREQLFREDLSTEAEE
jgi:hypothetical protein